MELALTLLPFVLLAIIMVLANLEAFQPAFRWITYAALASLNLMLLMVGLVGLMVSQVPMDQAVPGVPQEMLAATGAFMRVLFVVSVVAFLPLIRPVRALIARFTQIDPDVTVHTTALVYAVYALGVGLGQQPLVSDIDLVEGLDVGVTGSLLWVQALGMVLLALPGVGAFIRRNWQETAQRLGLAMPTLRQLGLALGSVLLLLLFQIAFGYLWQQLDPTGFARVDGIDSLLFGGMLNPLGALTIGLSAAIGEEMVFRGALQPRFGLVLTAILFTAVHSQYLLSPATLLILAIAIVLGLLRRYTTLTVCILVHFGFNFGGVMMTWAALPGT